MIAHFGLPSALRRQLMQVTLIFTRAGWAGRVERYSFEFRPFWRRLRGLFVRPRGFTCSFTLGACG